MLLTGTMKTTFIAMMMIAIAGLGAYAQSVAPAQGRGGNQVRLDLVRRAALPLINAATSGWPNAAG